MEQIGYSLVDSTGSEIIIWGDTFGQCQGIPTDIQLPSGDRVHCPAVGEDYQGLKLVPRYLNFSDSGAGISFDGANTLVIRPLSDFKAALKNQVDARAEQVRQVYITAGAGMVLSLIHI